MQLTKEKKILDFLKGEHLMVISTINENGKPQSAVVGFTETSELEIIFGTYNTTRKYANLKKNKNVAIVIGWDPKNKITVQYEGVAEEATKEELKRYQKIHIAKIPKREKHVHNFKERMFVIKPTWIRYSNLSKTPEEIFDVNF